MKFAALVSGGKDSIYSIQECIGNGHELVCCIHLGAPLSIEEESFMYQTAGSNVLPVLVEECLGVPLILHRRSGKSINISMVYENDENEEDEVEDLYAAIKKTLDQFPEVKAVSAGAILSNYQRKRLVLDEVEIEETEDGVGELKITKFHAEEKCDCPAKTLERKVQEALPEALRVGVPHKPSIMRPLRCLPHVQQLSGGLLHLSEVMSPFAAQTSKDESEAERTVKEALIVFDLLQQTLQAYGCNSRDVIHVHLYLSEISHFQNINHHYRDFFGTLLPPSRSTVAIGRNVLPGGRRVMLDCIVQTGSGDFMRGKASGNVYSEAALQTKTSELRHVLHVQSISHWAPVCVGPYSQVNTIRSGLHFIAGQIGLDPPLMKLKGGWRSQLKQSWTNMARILDCLEGGSLDNLLSCLIYTSAQVDDWNQVGEISRDMIVCNGEVLPGAVDSTAVVGERYGGYEDEDTWLEMTKNDAKKGFQIPILIVAIHEMPVGALVEVEAICVTQKALSCLEVQYSFNASESVLNPPVFTPSLGWNTGHDFLCGDNLPRPTMRLETTTVSIGTGCAAMSTIAVWTSATEFIDPESVCALILDAAITSLESARLGPHQMLNIRLYYVACSTDGEAVDDGIRWRSSLSSCLAAKASLLACNTSDKVRMPATSVIPVKGINFIREEARCNEPFIAAQVMAIDPVHMETELWIHNGRDQN
ncbi:hypothetical protein MHU86_3480 [Fragilaria crotonensis]|nr:hypothetical protein MHU86_3480 [Fragilaria crotonensis]